MQHGPIDLQAIDIRTLPPEQLHAVLRQATRRAHVERSRACRDLMGKARHGILAWLRRLPPAGRWAGYPN